MNTELIRRMAQLSDEEQALLMGLPLSQSTYTEEHLFVVNSDKLLSARQMIDVRPHTRFTPFPMHSHDYVEILYMLSGETIHDIPGREPLVLRAGELLMMNGQAMHAIRQCGENDVGVNFIIRPAFFDEALAAIGSSHALGRFLIDALKRGESSVSLFQSE